MKKLLLFTFVLMIITISSYAQNDTMYVMKNGYVIYKQSIKKEDVDSIVFYRPTVIDTMKGVFTDPRDGNSYNWVRIGKKIWMAENLAYLPEVSPVDDGSNIVKKYYVYGYDSTIVTEAKATSNYNTYGVLYNWVAAMNGEAQSTTNPSNVQGVCPVGWHLPSNEEWIELTKYSQDPGQIGQYIIEKGLSHWDFDSEFITNETGFTALPGGYRNNTNTFNEIGHIGYWWTSTSGGASNAEFRMLTSGSYFLSDVFIGEEYGFSVRCVKD